MLQMGMSRSYISCLACTCEHIFSLTLAISSFCFVFSMNKLGDRREPPFRLRHPRPETAFSSIISCMPLFRHGSELNSLMRLVLPALLGCAVVPFGHHHT